MEQQIWIETMETTTDEYRQEVNAQGRLDTISFLKRLSIPHRWVWENVNEKCYVPMHPDIGINRAGRVINPLTGRYL